jgi:hypothetical protein
VAASVVPGADAGQSGATSTPDIHPAAAPSEIAAGHIDAARKPNSATTDPAVPPGADQPDPPLPLEPSRRRLGWRWVARGAALLAVAVTVMMVALAIGMRANDAAIDEHLGTATATVLSVSALRTGAEFVDVTGTTIRPEGGVLYPGLLSVGQQFVIEYSTQDPQIARVAGRTSSVGTVMVGGTLAITWLLTLPVIWFCLRRARLPLLGLRHGPGHGAAPA